MIFAATSMHDISAFDFCMFFEDAIPGYLLL